MAYALVLLLLDGRCIRMFLYYESFGKEMRVSSLFLLELLRTAFCR